MHVQRAAALLVFPEVARDRLVADGEDLEAQQPADDLLGMEVLPQHRLDQRPILGGELGVSPRDAAAPVRVVLGLEGPLGPAILAPHVPAHLAADLGVGHGFRSLAGGLKPSPPQVTSPTFGCGDGVALTR